MAKSERNPYFGFGLSQKTTRVLGLSVFLVGAGLLVILRWPPHPSWIGLVDRQGGQPDIVGPFYTLDGCKTTVTEIGEIGGKCGHHCQKLTVDSASCDEIVDVDKFAIIQVLPESGGDK